VLEGGLWGHGVDMSVSEERTPFYTAVCTENSNLLITGASGISWSSDVWDAPGSSWSNIVWLHLGPPGPMASGCSWVPPDDWGSSQVEIEEKVGSTLERIGTGDQFLNITPTAQTLSATIIQWDYMKLRSFCKAKDTITKTKRQPTEWEKIFTNPTSDRGLISRIYKELKKHDIKPPNSPIEKWAIELNREFTAEEYQMVQKTLKEMLNILTHQRNANQNNSKIPSYTCQNG
ncbi:hypothetical protein STEG23_023931, partial [Scotinomys teguina]